MGSCNKSVRELSSICRRPGCVYRLAIGPVWDILDIAFPLSRPIPRLSHPAASVVSSCGRPSPTTRRPSSKKVLGYRAAGGQPSLAPARRCGPDDGASMEPHVATRVQHCIQQITRKEEAHARSSSCTLELRRGRPYKAPTMVGSPPGKSSSYDFGLPDGGFLSLGTPRVPSGKCTLSRDPPGRRGCRNRQLTPGALATAVRRPIVTGLVPTRRWRYHVKLDILGVV